MKTTLSEGREKIVDKIDQDYLVDFQDGVVQSVMIVLTVATVLIGIWGVVSLCGGIALGGGFVEMASGWLTAVGM